MGKQKGGFRRIDEVWTKQDKCLSPEHNPPSHIVLQPGKYEYTCPSCGKTTIVVIPLITM